MAGGQRTGARWIALLLGVALVASAIVAYALIRVTAPDAGGEEAVTSGQSSPTSAVDVSPANDSIMSPASAMLDRVPARSPTTPSSTAASTTTEPASSSTAVTPPPTASPPTTPPPTAGTSAPATPGRTSTAGTDAVPTVTSRLDGSGVTLPAAWSGTAKVTVMVLGDCATGSTSVYSDTPADLALDLPQNEASAVAPTVTTALPDEPTLSLGVNTAEVPSVAVYSSAVDDDGAFHRYWRLELTPGRDRTLISGSMIDRSADGTNPNIMVDAETSLQPCETAGTVGLPRVLAPGSTISGWVSQTGAKLTLRATTTDGKREVTVEVTATRKQ